MAAVPSVSTPSFRSYLRQPSHLARSLLVVAGGYGVALAAWEVAHLADLQAFVLKNDLPLDARRTLAFGLLVGMAASLVLWLGLGFLVSQRKVDRRRWEQAGRLAAVGIVLPLLPVLALPGLATAVPFFTLACLALMAAVAVIVVRSLRSGRPFDSHILGHGSDEIHALAPVAEPAQRLERIGLAVAAGLAAAYALFMTALTVARHDAHLTNAFDLGIHDQAIFNILHSGYMRTTLYGPYAIDYIGDHFSPVLYLLAPLYALRQDARTLLMLQSLFLGAAAIPLYLLARLKARSVWLALALVAAYLLHPALHGVNLDDFHQIALAPVLVLSALYFLETERDVPFLICLALALVVKEEVALTVAAIGGYAFFAKGRRKLGAAVMVGAMLYFGLVIGWVMPRLGGTPQIDSRFGGYIAPGTGGATGIAWTLFTNPAFTAIHVLGSPQKLLFLLQVFLPVLFLPLLASPVAWLVALPALAVQTLTTAHTQYDINYHYTAHLLPLVFFLAALALGRLRPVATRRGAATRGALAIAIVVAASSMALLYSRAVPNGGTAWPQPSAHDRVIDELAAQVPPGAAVSALGGIVPHLTARSTVYLFPDVADAEYLLLDTSLGANYWPYEGLGARERSLASMTPYVRSGEFGLVRAEDDVFLFRRGHDTRDNEAALRQMLSTRYEAEILPSDFDKSIAEDAEASGGKARAVTPDQRRDDGKAAIIYGPYTDLQPGNYRATFLVKGSAIAEDTRVLTLDVFTHKDGFPRAVREIYGRDLRAQPGYNSFALDFNTGGQALEDVEFRALYDFSAKVSLDLVDLEYLP